MAHAPGSPGQYAFDRFRLAADASLLLEGDARVALPPKVLHTLRVLLERAGQVVSKEELMRAVWPDTFVEETGLTRNVSLLRRALGDLGERLIVTVPRVGYRFTAPVRLVQGEAPLAGEGLPVFVGRNHELEHLHQALDRCRAGRGGIVGVAGEPGIGKTTLAMHFVASACLGCLVGVGRSSESSGPIEPHLPVLEALDRLAASTPVPRTLLALAPTWATHVRHTRAESVALPRADTPERLLRELTQFLAEISRAQPVVLLLDDLHWADTATADVIAHLAHRVGDMRVLILLLYRDRALRQAGSSFARVRDELRGKKLLHELHLPLLTREDVERYVAATSAPGVAAGVSDRVFARSEGNPLFMSALLAYLSGSASDTPSTQATTVPESLRGLIARLFDELDDVERDVLDTAATEGMEFDAHVVAAALGKDVLAVEDVLEQMEQVHGLVVRQMNALPGESHDGVGYRFRHVLYQAALLERLPPSRRASLARRVADALLARSTEARPVAGKAALLLELARAYGPAAERFVEASRHAADLLAFSDAYELAVRAMRCVERAVDLHPPERDRIELLVTLAQLGPLSSLRGFGHPAVEALANRASSLAAQLQDRQATALALGMTCYVRLVRAECTSARDAARQLAALAADAGQEALLVNAHVQAQIACHHLGHFADADTHAAEVMRGGLRLQPHERFMNVFDPLVASLAESSRNAWITGRLARAARLAEEAVATGSEVGHPESLAFAWLFHAWLYGYRRDWRTCVQSADTGLAVARHAGAVQTLAWNRCVRGWGRAHTGDPEGGRQELEEGIALSQSIMGEVAMPQFRAMMTEVLLLRADREQAREWIQDALAAAEHQDDGYFAAEVHRLAALTGTPGPRRLSPAQHLARALAVARAQGAAFFEVRAALTAYRLGHDASAMRDALARVSEPEPWPDIRDAHEHVS